MRRRLQLSILITLPKNFSPSTVIVRSKFWRSWKKRELSKVWFFDWSYETKTAFFSFDNPAQNFLAKHSKGSFKFRRVWKKRELSEVWFFDWSFEMKTAIFNFDIPAEKFFAEHVNCSFKFLKNLKKKRTFKSLIFWLIFWDEDCSFQFWYPCRKLFSPTQLILVQSSEEIEKKTELSKKFFFTQNVPLDT